MKLSVASKNDYSVITLKNKAGLTITLTSLGAAIREITVPDRYGKSKTVTLCPVNDADFVKAYHGKTIGRTAGRISGAEFTIKGRTAVLERNNFGTDNLHGGTNGFHVAKFGCEITQEKQYTDVVFSRVSRDGEGGYFGNVNVTVTYRISENENAFRIIFDGTADDETLLNLTNHVYFNMSGNLEESVKEQTLYINAPKVGRLNERLIIEEVVPVTNEFDFRKPRKIGEYINDENVQRHTNGYDHPYFLAPHDFGEVICRMCSRLSGISLEVRTTYPCVVFYSDSCPDDSVEVFPDKFDEQYLAACFECQYHPDGIHQTPDNCGIVSPAKPYHEETEYRFVIN